MATDLSIYSNFLRPPKTMQEYSAERDARDANQLGLQQARMNMLSAQQAQQDEQALRALYQQPGFDPQSDEGIGQLTRLNPKAGAAAYQARLAAGKLQAETVHLGAQTEREAAAATKATAEATGERLKQYRGALDFVDTPQGAARWLKAQFDDPLTASQMASLGSFDDAVTRIPQDPQGFQQWRAQAGMGMEKHIQAMQVAARDAETVRSHKASESLTARGQNMANQRAMDAADQGKVPPGYRKSADGNLEFIPGGPDDPARIDSKANSKPLAQSVTKQLTEARDNAATIDRLATSFKKDYAGNGILGFGADASLKAKGVIGADGDSVEWWKNYRKQVELVERHALFGAALTPTEQDSWRSADIDPGMDAKTIKRNLETRRALAKKIFENTAQDLIDAGHSEDRIRAIAGRNTNADGAASGDIHSQADAILRKGK